MSGDGEQEYRAAAELWMRTRCEEMEGLRFDFHPSLQGKTPDFVFWDLSEGRIVADVIVMSSGPMRNMEAQQRDYQEIRRKVHQVETDHFGTKVLSLEGDRSAKGPGGGPVAMERIARRVREMADELGGRYGEYPDWLMWEDPWLPGMRSATRRLVFPELSIDLELYVAFFLKGDETEEFRNRRRREEEGAIGVVSSFSDDARKRVEVVLRKKVSYLGEFRSEEEGLGKLPCLVMIFDPDSSVDRIDMEAALYGSSMGYDLGSGSLNEDLRQWTQRGGRKEAVSYGEGLFNGRHSRFLAVLKCTGDFRGTDRWDLSMWVNPYASYFSVPQPLFRECRQNSNLMVDYWGACECVRWGHGSSASASRYFGPGLGRIATPFARGRRQKGSTGQGQPTVSERGVLDSAYWGSVAGPATGLR